MTVKPCSRGIPGNRVRAARGCGTAPPVARNRVTRLEINPEHPEPHRLRQAIARLEGGQPIIYPTDTLYGLGADLQQTSAVQKLYGLRRLDPKKPLSLICSSLEEVGRYAVFSNDAFRFMRRHLPGPYTLILKATREAPRMGQSKRRTVGVRIPDHPVAIELIRMLGRPMLSTSVEEEGDEVQDPAIYAERFQAFEVGLILDAGILEGRSSTVIDWSDEEPELLREGAGPTDLFE